MSNQNDDNLNDQDEKDSAFVSKLYQQTKHQIPSSEVDDKVLAMARQHTAAASKSKAKPLWTKWQFATSIAASALFVAFIFMHTPNEPLESQLSPSLPPPSASKEEQADRFEPEVATLRDAKEMALLKQRASSEKRKMVAEEMQNADDLEAITVTGSRIVDIDPYIEEIYSELIALKAELTESEQLQSLVAKPEQEDSLLQEYDDLQSLLFDFLIEQKAEQDDWQLDTKYKQVLTEAQWEKLTASSQD
ncbi:hypothetical protein [Glaciecola sp. 1036]|uniref:hypothetical protein n=1 Tax=Alteromonadaceae TaxID=72275 RepID=UPI003D088710